MILLWIRNTALETWGREDQKSLWEAGWKSSHSVQGTWVQAVTWREEETREGRWHLAMPKQRPRHLLVVGHMHFREELKCPLVTS